MLKLNGDGRWEMGARRRADRRGARSSLFGLAAAEFPEAVGREHHKREEAGEDSGWFGYGGFAGARGCCGRYV